MTDERVSDCKLCRRSR